MSDTLAFSAPLQSMAIEEGYDPIGYVHLPPEAAEQATGHEISRRLELGKRRGFGSIKVTVRVGGSQWATSMFPLKGRAGWFLPIKKPVRLAEGLADGDTVEVELELL